MKDIGVYTNEHTLSHKIEVTQKTNDDNEQMAYWTVPLRGNETLEEMSERLYSEEFGDGVSTPINIDSKLERIWFASKKHWQGYFEVFSVEENDVFLFKWVPLDDSHNYPRKPFQGFTYSVPEVQ